MIITDLGTRARTYVEENGGMVTPREKGRGYEVEVPDGTIATGGYTYHGGSCRLYAYPDGMVLDCSVETTEAMLRLKYLKKNMLKHFIVELIEDWDQFESLAKE